MWVAVTGGHGHGHGLADHDPQKNRTCGTGLMGLGTAFM